MKYETDAYAGRSLGIIDGLKQALRGRGSERRYDLHQDYLLPDPVQKPAEDFFGGQQTLLDLILPASQEERASEQCTEKMKHLSDLLGNSVGFLNMSPLQIDRQFSNGEFGNNSCELKFGESFKLELKTTVPKIFYSLTAEVQPERGEVAIRHAVLGSV